MNPTFVDIRAQTMEVKADRSDGQIGTLIGLSSLWLDRLACSPLDLVSRLEGLLNPRLSSNPISSDFIRCREISGGDLSGLPSLISRPSPFGYRPTAIPGTTCLTMPYLLTLNCLAHELILIRLYLAVRGEEGSGERSKRRLQGLGY